MASFCRHGSVVVFCKPFANDLMDSLRCRLEYILPPFNTDKTGGGVQIPCVGTVASKVVWALPCLSVLE